MIIKITEQSAGVRLDKFLANSNLLKLSRNQIQKLIEQGLININNLTVSSHYFLKPGDIINVAKNLSSNKKLIDKKKFTRLDNKHLAGFVSAPCHKIKIIHETDEFLVINKPAGLAIHGSANYTLADWLMEKYPGIIQVGEDSERPGIVHRLDKDVSGLMVIAKTQTTFNNLKKQFQNRTVKKQYTALVHGKIKKDSATINFPIKRARKGYKMAAMPATTRGEPTQAGRMAETEFQIKQRLINYTLLKIKIKTGRTHQIRVHLTAYDHPIVGDNIYSTVKTRMQNKKLGLSRIFLIADRLSFIDLKNKRQNYKINLPEELKNILKNRLVA
ncbi:RluA family pseudouridine synthase [Patescibacteria group bacterium]|nr:RluA family pseudouridine synthase [Patescibacteria group bacterium]MBU1663139.1 RluA family pseudouridine synthase [Patescibacteria group bacterium]MBU1933665.1 RluA family pseudouridine synthase [Patescibacteria group bacterium]MBU2008124.1 RluA family pseudouridine synthase [Patescibacteria group bacterium]MBU2233469.1 RluA family pseudouridine synthase [Patescibacteria group bacterium]